MKILRSRALEPPVRTALECLLQVIAALLDHLPPLLAELADNRTLAESCFAAVSFPWPLRHRSVVMAGTYLPAELDLLE